MRKDTDKGQEVLASFKEMQAVRQELETNWKDAYKYTKPHRGQRLLRNAGFFDGDLPTVANAKSDQAEIYDSTAIDAVNLLAASIVSALTPASNQWFDFTIPGYPVDVIDLETKEWLSQSGQKLFSLIHTSNYNGTALEFFQDIAIAGMSALYVTKRPGGPFVFEQWHLEDLYVADTLGTGRIDTVYRPLMLKATQAASLFDSLPDQVKEALKEKPSKKFPFIHAIRPRMRNGRQMQGKANKTMPWESIYVCASTGQIVKTSGFEEFPVIIPRWSVIPRTEYALGPLNDALPDVKTLNSVIEMMLSNAEMAIAGTYVAKADGILNNNNIKIRSRQVVFAADPDNIRPLTSAGNFTIAYQEIQRLQQQIRAVMMADDLSPIQKDYASATEVSTRTQIIRAILGPVYARLQAEILDPLLDRCFRLAFRDGEFGEAPEVVAQTGFVPVYTSPMVRAAKTEEVASIERYLGAVAQSAQLFPRMLDNIDPDKTSRKLAELGGVPFDIMRSPQEVAILRQQQAEQQQAEQQMMMEQQANG